MAVGVRGKTVEGEASAGLVTVVSETGVDCGTVVGRQITQNTAMVAGSVKAGNGFGTAFVSVPVVDLASDGLLAGAPGAKKTSGRVVNVVNLPKTSYTSLGGAVQGGFYGNVTTQR